MKRLWVGRAISATLLGTAAGAILWLVGSLPTEPGTAALTIGALVATLGILWWSSSDLPRPAEAASWYVVRQDEASVPQALDYRLVRLRRDLRDAIQHTDRPDQIYPLVRRLARDRLNERHSIDLEQEPERAAQALSPALGSYLAHPPIDTGKCSATQLAHALTGIEEL